MKGTSSALCVEVQTVRPPSILSFMKGKDVQYSLRTSCAPHRRRYNSHHECIRHRHFGSRSLERHHARRAGKHLHLTYACHNSPAGPCMYDTAQSLASMQETLQIIKCCWGLLILSRGQQRLWQGLPVETSSLVLLITISGRAHRQISALGWQNAS